MPDFSLIARNFADALIACGTDHYGVRDTPLFCHFIDLETLTIPAQKTAAEWRELMADWEEDRGYLMWGKDRSNLMWAHQSNLLWDTETVRLFIKLSESTGDQRYAEAAHSCMAYFLEHCVSRETGLFAWGEHVAYNVLSDRIEGERHELQHADPLWEELWQISPKKVQREIEAIFRFHVVDKTAMIYDRHARFWDGLPERDQATILGYAGTFAKAWVFLWTKTRNPEYLRWARNQLLAFQSKSNGSGLYPDNWTDSDKRQLPRSYPARPGLARDMFDIYLMTGMREWLDDGCRYLEACVALRHEERRRMGTQDDPVFGSDVAAGIAVLISAFDVTRDRHWRDLALEYGRALAAEPIPVPLMASRLAERIQAFCALHDATGDPGWLSRAIREAEYAVATFVHSSGLIKGTAPVRRRDYYDAIQGSGKLALALFSLGAVLRSEGKADRKNREAVSVSGTIPPSLDVLSLPAKLPNHLPTVVRAEIRHPDGIQKAVLHYSVGYRVGLADFAPVREGPVFRFRIPPLEPFEGEVRLAVEAFSGGSPQSRTITAWQTLSVRIVETLVADLAGCAAGERTPVHVEGLLPGDSVTVETEPCECVDDHIPPPPWRRAPFMIRLSAPHRESARIVFAYSAHHVDRLVEDTIRPAVLDEKSGAWRILTSASVNTGTRTITSQFVHSGLWTICGLSRVRWQAPQREANATVGDIDGDGRLEVALTQYANAELLNSDGSSRHVFGLQTSNRPVQNTSSPLIADINADGRSEVVYGATSGHVHAFSPDGVELWRTPVGGEVRGGIAAAMSEGGRPVCLCVSWHDAGVALLNPDGSVRWQHSLTPPADTTPVVCTPRAGEPFVVLAHGDGLIAFRCADGEVLWQYRTDEGTPVAPAIGEVSRSGEPWIVTGTPSGMIHVLDTRGKVHSRWVVPAVHKAYRPIIEVGMASLRDSTTRQIVATTAGGVVVAYECDGTPLWQFVSREQVTGFALGVGGRLAFADVDADGLHEVLIAEQDQYVYSLNGDGSVMWEFRGAFFYHYSPVVADLDGQGDLTLITTSPCQNGTYALRAGRRIPGASRTPWPTMRGNFARANCAPWPE
ncbi:MAG: Pectate disaccharide-lyase [Candidatus Latescibacteria bacterium ADurb.Bin168]|nr:MAG: Pectate disaccharide-lyase [Candidatus Latescibacteria bacterium ADurb.Bin168]